MQNLSNFASEALYFQKEATHLKFETHFGSVNVCLVSSPNVARLPTVRIRHCNIVPIKTGREILHTYAAVPHERLVYIIGWVIGYI